MNIASSMLGTAGLTRDYERVRKQSAALCQPLCVDDYGLQAIAETSPPKWHLAHTTWFFETFLLKPFVAGYRPVNPAYEHLFNSYYNGVGQQYARDQRGLLSRPTVDEIYRYRDSVDERMLALLADRNRSDSAVIVQRTRLGLHHEMQHQELLLTDLKYSLAQNPMYPAYQAAESQALPNSSVQLAFRDQAGGLVNLGVDSSDEPFVFDNETPQHSVFLSPYALANRPVTNGEYLQFMQDDGYQRAELWLADGWALVQEKAWQAPLYWQHHADDWQSFTLHGLQPLDLAAPVCHVSFYEADAYARWVGARLPTEAEWEHAAGKVEFSGHFADARRFQPQAAAAADSDMLQMFGDVWEWTASSYGPYPGFVAAAGAIGEYNGKFMCNQMVLRGGSCVSDRAHIRGSYRNFFYPPDRWQFTGIRLAR